MKRKLRRHASFTTAEVGGQFALVAYIERVAESQISFIPMRRGNPLFFSSGSEDKGPGETSLRGNSFAPTPRVPAQRDAFEQGFDLEHPALRSAILQVLEKLLTRSTRHLVRRDLFSQFAFNWQRIRDSNPCTGLERAVS